MAQLNFKSSAPILSLSVQTPLKTLAWSPWAQSWAVWAANGLLVRLEARR
jgi:hypothetical protein